MKVFGTDGIRGKAGTGYITPEFMINIPSAIAKLKNFTTKRVIIGKDTRISCYSIESALVAGFTANGFEVILTGPIPTPAVSMLVKSLRADYGIMISASHNEYYDNGIKIFGNNGVKISYEIEKKIEDFLQSKHEYDYVTHDGFGMVKRLDDVIGRYVEHVKSSVPSNQNFSGIKILLDCANGSAYKIAPEIFWEMGCSVKAYNSKPNGVNINQGCGAIHPEFLSSKIKEEGCDIGIILDGDADRLIAVDENGSVIDGDYIMAAITYNMMSLNLLDKKGIILTVMSNLGLENYLKSIGIEDVIRVDVGDKNVIQKLIETDYNIGGEQSGHIILPQYSSTGDGILSAIQLIMAIKTQKWKASDISKLYTKVPQILVNIVNEKISDEKMLEINKKYSDQETRVLVRRSGTEYSKVRIMAEGTGNIKEIVKNIEIEIACL